MVEPASVETTRLPNLPTRPPTPPKESSSAASHIVEEPSPGSIFSKLSSSLLRYGGSRRSSAPVSASNITPESSAETPIESSLTSSAIARKRVGWSEWPDYKEAPRVSLDGKFTFEQPLLPLPPSAERKPTKSILKAYNGPQEQEYSGLGNGSILLPPHKYASFAAMLESIVQQLAQKEKRLKQDAYNTLSGSLKASDNVPDQKALSMKMGLLLQFIMRDLTEKTETGKPDPPLATTALVLLSSFLQKPAIADAFTPEFPVTFIDHAVKTFEDPQMSKEIVKHLMFAVAQQKFSSKVMNSERVGKLITGLQSIEIYVKGKSVVMGRINIYRTLLRQSRAHMIHHTVWIENVFTDMLSTEKDVRELAITFGLECSYTLGSESKVSRSVINLLNLEKSEGEKYSEFYCARLSAVVEKKQSSSYIPQIWSILMLFLRGKDLDQSPFLQQFSGVIQGCFNTSDRQTKLEANYAWNRLVFCLQPGEKADRTKIVNFRKNPLATQLKIRKSTTERKAALGSVCNLLYYSLKPSATPNELDLYWDEYVVNLVGRCLIPTNVTDKPDIALRDLTDACLILRNLFDSTSKKIWSENRAMANLQQNSVEAKELPALDSKWLRNRTTRVFPLISQLLNKLFWNLGEESSSITSVFQAYITSIASPAAMEVKVSNDTLTCVAHIFSFLLGIWTAGPKSVPTSPGSKLFSNSDFVASFEKIVMVTIQGLGLLPFIERQLSIGSDAFFPVATPSHRPGKIKGEIKTPFHHLLFLVATICPGLEYDAHFSHMIHSILSPFFEEKKSSKARIGLAKDLSQYLPAANTQPCKMIWRVLADFATTATDTRDDILGSNDHPLGADYRSVVKILETGINFSPRDLLSGWNTLFEALVTSATLDAGNAGRAIAVIEPLAKFFMAQNLTGAERSYSEGLLYYHHVVTKATYPKDRQALDAGRKRLWGTMNTGSKVPSFDPYAQLYEYISKTLESTYASFSKRRPHDYTAMLLATKELLVRCPNELIYGLLVKVQEGISHWIIDINTHLTSGNDLTKEVSAFWNLICSRLTTVLESYDSSKVLADMTALLCSGLESKHRSIVSQAVRLWNSTFGSSKQTLTYPDRVKDALLRLHSVADLQLPFFPESLESQNVSEHRQPVDFAESQEDLNFLPTTSMEAALRKQRTPLPASSGFTPQVVINIPSSVSGSTGKRSREDSVQLGTRKARKRDIPTKLRHEDSQTTFQPVIDSSPIPGNIHESQLLTERQKEVKERQQAEAAMFPDLGSSPKPKGKAVAREESAEPELPLHRSSSRSQTRSPLRTERPTTPTALPPSEDDNFMVSSPTPKRSSQPQVDPSMVPSSPPEAVVKKPQLIAAEEPDVPSSPPEMPEESDMEPTTSVEYPSAQFDPYTMDIDRTVSTFASTPGQKSNISADEAAGHLQTSSGRQVPDDSKLAPDLTSDKDDEPGAKPSLYLATLELLDGPPESSPVDVEMQVPSSDKLPRQFNNDPPSTPSRRTRSHASRPESDQPSSPTQFVDAFSSPPSSDNHNSEEVFEDAVSSPKLVIETKQAGPSSSPISDFDESSLLRVVQGYDEGSGRAPDTSPGRQTRASLKKFPSPKGKGANANPSSPSMRKAALINATSIQTGQTPQKKQIAATDDAPQSSAASLIPETPAPKARRAVSSPKIIAEGHEFDPEDTIVVDASALELLDSNRVAKLKGKRSVIRKRKREESSQESEVPDSQEGLGLAASQESTPPPPKKRGRKRKSELSQSQSQSHTSQLSQSQGAEASQGVDMNQSFASVDLDSALLDETKLEPTNPEVDPETMDMEKGNPKQAAPSNIEDSPAENNQLATFIAETEVPSKAPVDPNGSTFSRVDETRMDESSPRESSYVSPYKSPYKSPYASKTIPKTASQKVPVASSAPAESSDPKPPAAQNPEPSPAPIETAKSSSPPEASTVQTIKGILHGVIGRLGTAVFSSTDVSEMEDLFNDMKEQLYGARRRGRQVGL